MPESERWEVGRVLAAHGLKGELRIQLFRADPRSLEGGQITLVRPNERRTFAIEDVRWIDAVTARVALEGLDDRTAAESYRGATIEVEGDWFEEGDEPVEALIGARAVDDADGREIGRVRGVMDNGAQLVLVIESEATGEHMIPFVEAFIADVREEAGEREIRVRVIPGLLD